MGRGRTYRKQSATALPIFIIVGIVLLIAIVGVVTQLPDNTFTELLRSTSAHSSQTIPAKNIGGSAIDDALNMQLSSGTPLSGSVDTISATTIAGWAYDPDAPTTPVNISISIDGVLVAVLVTDQVRSDVDGSLGSTGTRGFYYTFSNFPSGSHLVVVSAKSNGKTWQWPATWVTNGISPACTQTLASLCLPSDSWRELFVAPYGDDAADGTVERPFKTLDRARDVIRSIGTMQGNITVYLRGGVYQLSAPLTLDSTDSGRNGFTIAWRAYPGERPILSGGQYITNWEVQPNGFWKAHIGNVESRSFYMNGQLAQRAGSYSLNDQNFAWTSTGYAVVKGVLPAMTAVQDIEVAGTQQSSVGGWRHSRCKVASISSVDYYGLQRDALIMQEPCWSAANAFDHVAKVMSVENAYELLDEPGEWYLNRGAGDIYYKPRSGEVAGTSVGILPTTERLLQVSGTVDSSFAHDLRFEGLTFTYTTWLRPSTSDGFPEFGNNVYGNPYYENNWPYASVEFSNVDNVAIIGNLFTNLGGSATLSMNDASQHVSIVSNHIVNVSGNGIDVGSLSAWLASENLRHVTRLVNISNNFIHAANKEYLGGIGIFAGTVQDMTIEQNEISDLPYSGIVVGWITMNYTSLVRRNRIVNNYIHDHMQTMSDGGGVYAVGSQSPERSLISGNYIANQGHLQGGIYLDEGSTYWTVTSNVVTTYLPLFYKCTNHMITDNCWGNSMPPQWGLSLGCVDVTQFEQSANTIGSAYPIQPMHPVCSNIIAAAGIQSQYLGVKNLALDWNAMSDAATAPTTPGTPALSSEENSVALSWTPSTDNVGVVGYIISRDGVPITRVSALSYRDIGLSGGTYSYTVTAYDAAGRTAASGSASATVAGGPAAAPFNDAACESFNAPSTVFIGESFSTTLVMRNNGTEQWNYTGNSLTDHKLGRPDGYWSTSRVNLPSSTVIPGAPASFSFTATAPLTPGTHEFNWQMVKEGITWFGQPCTKQIEVIPHPIAGYIDIFNATHLLGWSFDPDANTSSITVTITVDGSVLTSFATNSNRGDVNTGFNITGMHGIYYEFPALSAGTHTVNVSTSNNGKTWSWPLTQVTSVTTPPTTPYERSLGGPPIVTSLYLWFPAPHNDYEALNSPATWVYDPPESDGSTDQSYYEHIFSDLHQAGLTGAFLSEELVVDTPLSWNDGQKLEKAVAAIHARNIDFKLSPYFSFTEPDPAHAGDFAYDNLIKPFFSKVSTNLWLTHNGLSPANGGRPMIYLWDVGDQSLNFDQAIVRINQRFQQDFGVLPFWTATYETHTLLVQRYGQSAADSYLQGIIPWNSPIGGRMSMSLNGYKTNAVGVGNNEGLIRSWRCYSNPAHSGYSTGAPGSNYRARGNSSDAAAWLRSSFGTIEPDINLLFIQDANELNEGTTWLRAVNFPRQENPVFNYCAPEYASPRPVRFSGVRELYDATDDKRYLPNDFYLGTVQALIMGTYRHCASAASRSNTDLAAPTGTVSVLNCSQISGTASDVDATKAAWIEVAEGAKLLASKPAISGQFEVELPFVNDGKQHTLTVRVLNSDSAGFCSTDHNTVVITTQTITCSNPLDAQAPLGHIDVATCSLLEGWTVDRDTQTHPNTIVVKDSGERVIGVLNASQYRTDLLSAGFTNASHGFRLPNPPFLRGVNGTISLFMSSIDSLGEPGSIALVPLGQVTLTSPCPVHWFLDSDRDGYGDEAQNITQRTYPDSGRYVANSLDCNDANDLVHPSATELCNSIDDNCNGVVDEGCSCVSGATSSDGCEQRGACAGAIKTCTAGVWSACSKLPTTEACNDKDDDCNGVVDDNPASICVSPQHYCSSGTCVSCLNTVPVAATIACGTTQTPLLCTGETASVTGTMCNTAGQVCHTGTCISNQCTPGTTQSCYDGAQGTAGVGTCVAGTQTCGATGLWGTCNGAIIPTTETCNGKDDNCNGVVDENPSTICGNLQYCSSGSCVACIPSAPSAATIACGTTQTPLLCTGETASVTGTMCNTAGQVCHTGTCISNQCTPGTTQSCYDGAQGTAGVGTCVAGTQTCAATGTWNACTGQTVPTTETCNNKDDNCNGQVDEGLTQTGTCNTIGACAGAHETCHAGLWSSCSKLPGTESCNGLDDDCDGSVDEGVTTTYYQDSDLDGYGNTSITTQSCAQPTGYALTHNDCNDHNNTVNPGATEICNGIDDNCNGVADENPASICTTGNYCTSNTCTSCTASTPAADTITCGSTQQILLCTGAIVPVTGTHCNSNTQICNGTTCISNQCAVGTTQSCYSGAAQTLGIGACIAGTQTCGATGTWNSCVGEIIPHTELCNRVDDDCDGRVDEGCVSGNVSVHTTGGVNTTVGNSSNLSQPFNGIQTVTITFGQTVTEFPHNFSTPLNLSTISIGQTNTTNRSNLLVTGIALPLGTTKTITLPINAAGAVCIMDTDDATLSNITTTCSGAVKTLVRCPGTNGTYACSVVDQSYRITGSTHTLVYELNTTTYNARTPVCGNDIIETGESCDDGISNGACPMTCSSTCTANSCTSGNGGGSGSGSGGSSGGGGGGGGSGGGSVPAAPTIDATHEWYNLEAGSRILFNVNRENISITNITFTMKNPMSHLTIGLNRTTITNPPLALTYQALQIADGGIDKTATDFALSIRVRNSWLANNKLTASDVLLYRKETTWNKYALTQTSHDTTYAYFTANVPGLSTYLIGAQTPTSTTPLPNTQETKQPTKNTTPIVVPNEVSPDKPAPEETEIAPNNTSTPDAPQSTPWTQGSSITWIIASIALISIIGVIIGSTRKKHASAAHHDNDYHDALRDYIQRMIAQGHTAHDIKQALLNKGWPEATVNQSLETLGNAADPAEESTTKQKMEHPRTPLNDYISTCMQKGATIEQIQEKLVNAGWNKETIEGILKEYK